MSLSLYSENELLTKFREINQTSFQIDSLPFKDPHRLFMSWLKTAQASENIHEPSAMCLATCSLEGRPSCRMVLARSITEEGFVFYTNYNSKKAQELDSNPLASVCIYWDSIQKQVVMDGAVKKISFEDSKAYFESRDIESQICFKVSEQGKVLKHKQHLILAKEQAQKEFENKEQIPYPSEWGGYIFVPKKYEFWQSDVNQLDNRILFRKSTDDEFIDKEYVTVGENGWLIQTLSP